MINPLDFNLIIEQKWNKENKNQKIIKLNMKRFLNLKKIGNLCQFKKEDL